MARRQYGTAAVADIAATCPRAVAAARARLRTAVRVIAGVTALTALGLIVLNRSYLDSYWTPTGQGVLAVVAVTWGIGLWWLAKMGDFIAPERFLVADAEDRE